jgi:phenylalanyl-tRNA synthetase beta chain
MLSFLKKLFGPKPTKIFPGIVAARVLDVQKHPNADRLRIVKLDVGDKIIDPVVCGAMNFGVGDMVALALPGAQIAQNIHSETHEPFILEKAKIRGIESQGMICAGFELGLTKEPGDKPEIMLLKPEVRPGKEFEPGMVK